MRDPAMNVSMPCGVVLTPAGGDELVLGFVLTNPLGRPIALEAYEPFVQFRMWAAVAGGPELPIEQPTLDISLQPVTVTVPASGTAELATPVRLRFRAGAPPPQERFVWSIAHAPAGVQLTFMLELPPPFDRPFQVQP